MGDPGRRGPAALSEGFRTMDTLVSKEQALTTEESRPARRWLMAAVKAVRPLASRWGPVGVLVTGLVAAGVLLVESARRLWFFGDDWEFLLYRGTVPGADLGLLAPHNEHWSTIPILIFRAVFAVVGLRHYLPYALPVIAAHLGVVALMYLLLVRFGTSRWVAVVVCLFLAFLGAGAEDTLWDFQIGFVGSVFFGLLALWLYDRNEQRGWRLPVVWVAVVLALMCSGIGLAMLSIVLVYAAARRGLVHAALVASVPLAVYAAWYLGWGRLAAQLPVSSRWDYLQVPQYVWTGLTNAWERSSAIPGSGAIILLVLIGAALMARSTPAKLRLFAWAGLAGALAQLLLSGVTRISFGVEQAASSRYVYIVSVLMAPALALVLQLVTNRLTEPRWVPTCLLVGLAALVVVNGVWLTHEFLMARRALVGSMPERVQSAAAIVRQNGRVLTPKLEPTYNPDITTALLASPQIQDALPHRPPSDQGLVDAASRIQVGVNRAEMSVPNAAAVTFVSGFVGGTTAASGCHVYQATVRAPVVTLPATPTGSQIRITSATTSLSTVLRRGPLTSGSVRWPVQPGSPVFVGTSAPNASLQITLDRGGMVTLCVR